MTNNSAFLLLIIEWNSAKMEPTEVKVMKSTITIHNVEKAREFVAMTNRFPKIRLMLHEGDYDIDAHSIIGILSLDLSQPIELIAEGDITDEFLTALEPFLA